MKRAFTLVEIIIVIAVVGVLVAILVPVFTNVIAKSISKSALSDMRNTLDSLFSDYNEARGTNLVIAVVKNGKLFVYGWYHKENTFMESKNSPYKFEDEDITEFLTDLGCFSSDSSPVNITEKIEDPLPSVTVFSDCSLSDIDVTVTLERSTVTIGVGEEYMLYHDIEPYYDTPLMPIVWESSDPETVEVSGGIIKGKKIGKSTVTAQYGNSTSSIDIDVEEWIDFDGTFADIKAIIENDVTPVLIRLSSEVYLYDYPDIFPIVVPQGKTVVIDFAGNRLNYSYSADEYRITGLFVNDGGDMRLGIGIEKGKMSEIIIQNPSANAKPVEYAVLNINSAKLTINTNLTLYGQPIRNIAASCTVIGGKVAYDSLNQEEIVGLYNGEGAELNIHGGQIKGIKNHGTIRRITGGNISAAYYKQSGDAIVNYGVIDLISGGHIGAATDNWSESGQNFDSAAIKNSGSSAVINHIAGGEFNDVNYIDDIYAGSDNENEEEVYESDIPSYALSFENGASLGKITGGKLYSYKEPISFDSSFHAKRQVSGGCYLHKPKDKLISKDCSCLWQSYYWRVINDN